MRYKIKKNGKKLRKRVTLFLGLIDEENPKLIPMNAKEIN